MLLVLMETWRRRLWIQRTACLQGFGDHIYLFKLVFAMETDAPLRSRNVVLIHPFWVLLCKEPDDFGDVGFCAL